MPISCPLNIRPLTAEEFQSVDYRVMGHAFACQNRLGCLCEEDAYQHDLLARLSAGGFESVNIEVPVTVTYRDFEKTYFIDLVADNAVYELKTVSALNTEHQAQLLNYLFLLGVPRGTLLNFRPRKGTLAVFSSISRGRNPGDWGLAESYDSQPSEYPKLDAVLRWAKQYGQPVDIPFR
jgi:GxxExxY protein